MRNEIMKNVQRDLRNDAAAPLAGSTDKALFHSDMGTIVLYHTGVKEHQPLFERIFRAHHYLWLTQGMELDMFRSWIVMFHIASGLSFSTQTLSKLLRDIGFTVNVIQVKGSETGEFWSKMEAYPEDEEPDVPFDFDQQQISVFISLLAMRKQLGAANYDAYMDRRLKAVARMLGVEEYIRSSWFNNKAMSSVTNYLQQFYSLRGSIFQWVRNERNGKLFTPASTNILKMAYDLWYNNCVRTRR